MSQRWLKYLEKFGLQGKTPAPVVEDDELADVLENPQAFKRYDVLFRLFGPLQGSPWVPYHCPTLFASIDRLNIVPKKVKLAPGYHEPHPPTAWQWLDDSTMVIVDLPNGAAIEVGATLMEHGAQLICTFDHWPLSSSNRRAKPAIEALRVIHAMYTVAPDVYKFRKKLTPDATPVWLCDNRRLGDNIPTPSPGTFDNRYYIDDSILPGISTLKRAGIRRIVHLNLNAKLEPLPDLVPLLINAHEASIELAQVALEDESSWSQPMPMDVPFKRSLPMRSFRRTDMGGFGQMIPVPSEGSYSSGGGGG